MVMKVMPDTIECRVCGYISLGILLCVKVVTYSASPHFGSEGLRQYLVLHRCCITVLQSLDCIKCNHKVTHHGLHLVGTWQER